MEVELQIVFKIQITEYLLLQLPLKANLQMIITLILIKMMKTLIQVQMII